MDKYAIRDMKLRELEENILRQAVIADIAFIKQLERVIDGQNPSARYKSMSFEDAVTLTKFYESIHNKEKPNFKQLSRLELDTHIIEDFMDTKLVKLLVKYNELVD